MASLQWGIWTQVQEGDASTEASQHLTWLHSGTRGGGWESNPPGVFQPLAGFEVRWLPSVWCRRVWSVLVRFVGKRFAAMGRGLTRQ